ncbi:MAG: LysR family transcriptional regulator [Burkholderiales bacterium]
MELRDIEYFSVIAEHRNLGRAAEALGLSQPALSMSLRRLEKSMQAKLVRRTPNGVELTAVGSALLLRVHPLRLSMSDVAREAADLSQGRAGHVRVGAAPEFAEYLLPLAFRELFGRAPKVTVNVTVAAPDVLRPALRKGDLDVIVTGVAGAPYEGLLHVPLFEDEFVVVSSAAHRLAGQTRVTIPDLAGERWAAAAPGILAWKWLNQMFKNHGLPAPELAMESTSAWVRLLTIASSELLGFSSKRFLQQVASHISLAVLHVPESTWARRIGVSVRQEAYLPPAATRLTEIFKKIAARIAAENP